MSGTPNEQVATLKMNDGQYGGMLRRVDDLDLHRRRSTTLLDAPHSSDSGKVWSFGRGRNSGINRLLRSNASSNNSRRLHYHNPTSTANYASAIDDTTALDEDHERLNGHYGGRHSIAEHDDENGDNDDGPTSGSSSFHSALDHDDGALEDDLDAPVSEYQGHSFPDQTWTHLVLKMTAFTDDDVVTSFRFGTAGGTIGRDASNTASVPADKLMQHEAHATLLYAHGGFYLQNGTSSAAVDTGGSSTTSSGTFVRLGASCMDADSEEAEDDAGNRMQWPLDVDVSFRAGKSDFVVVAVNELAQTLELQAQSGKLAGSTFTITTDGAGIGRSADNAIHAGDGELSRKHAAIWFDDLTHKFYLVDCGSTNGTFMRLSGPYNEPYRLEIGDDLLVAQTCLTVNRFDFGVHANMGQRKTMEDAHTIIQDLSIDALSCLGLWPQSFFGVYDGHGGAEASLFLGDALHHNVIDAFRFTKKQFDPLMATASQAELQDVITTQLIAAFEATDAEFLRDSARPQAGSTATTVFIAGSTLFVANVGDSRTVLSRQRVAVRLSNDHKPSRKDEAQRIRDTGGFVIHGRIMGELAVSRAFGDAPFKTFDGSIGGSDERGGVRLHKPVPHGRPLVVDQTTTAAHATCETTTAAAAAATSAQQLHRNSNSSTALATDAATTTTQAQGPQQMQQLPINPNDMLKGPLVIATPEVTITELTDNDEFLLLASDGLFDVMRDQDAVDFIRHKLLEVHDVQRAVEALVEHAIFQQRSTDNVTAIVIMLKAPSELRDVVLV